MRAVSENLSMFGVFIHEWLYASISCGRRSSCMADPSSVSERGAGRGG